MKTVSRWMWMLIPTTALALVTLLLWLFVSPRAAPARSREGDAGLDGFWVSDGYGFLVEIRGAELRLSQTTALSCDKVAVARRLVDKRAGAGAVFEVDDERSSPVLDVDSGLMTISTGRTPEIRRLRVDGAISDIVLKRAPSAPGTCATPDVDTPLNNFDIFWQTYREHYPFFALHGVDWDAVRERYRPQVTDATTPEQLHKIFVKMIKPLEDAHTYVELPAEDREYGGERPDPQPLTDAQFERVTEIVDDRLVGKRRSFAYDEVFFGRLPHGIGYLEIASFSEYTDSGRLSAALVELDHALDAAFAKPMTGLVIDVRVNDGGSDTLGVAIASRLTRTPYTAYAKTARNDPADPRAFTTPQQITVKPSDAPTFNGPVALLTSRYSISAAETFAQALLGRPNVVRIGENTQGVFSDVLIRQLPNGAVFELPNEVYTTNGRSFDKVGVAPDIRTGPVFKRSNLQAGRDPELDAAIRHLTRRS